MRAYLGCIENAAVFLARPATTFRSAFVHANHLRPRERFLPVIQRPLDARLAAMERRFPSKLCRLETNIETLSWGGRIEKMDGWKSEIEELKKFEKGVRRCGQDGEVRRMPITHHQPEEGCFVWSTRTAGHVILTLTVDGSSFHLRSCLLRTFPASKFFIWARKVGYSFSDEILEQRGRVRSWLNTGWIFNYRD